MKPNKSEKEKQANKYEREQSEQKSIMIGEIWKRKTPKIRKLKMQLYKRKNVKRTILQRTNLKNDNSETDLDAQPGPVNQVRSTRSGPKAHMEGGMAIRVYTWLCSVANKYKYK